MSGDRLMYTAGPLTMTSYGKTLTMKSGGTGMRYQKYFGHYAAEATGAWKASFDT
jgi:hypothetical protein